jgi:multidrug efflux pump
VALTALAAILGMIPLAGSIFWGPMAITIMGGLFVATVLTLIVVPVLYALWFRVHADEGATSAPTIAADLFPEGMDVQAWARWAEGKPTEEKLTEAKEIA